jgi:hypothetical protein
MKSENPEAMGSASLTHPTLADWVREANMTLNDAGEAWEVA